MWKLLSRNSKPAAPPPAPRATPPVKKRAGRSFLFGAEEIPDRFAEFDTLISGGKGTGKTTALLAQMDSHIESKLRSGKPFNVKAYTPKPDDFFPFLKEKYEPLGMSVRSTNPFIEGSWCWDGCLDLTCPPKIDELVAALMKDDGREQNPFFKKAAQLFLRGVTQSLSTTHPGVWTWRQLANCMKSVSLIRQIVSRCEETRYVLDLFSASQDVTAANIYSQILTELKGLDLVASLLDETPDDRKFSIAEAANRPGVIWVAGSDPRYATTVEPWNGIQWELIGHELLIRGDIGLDTLVFIDEFPQLNGGQKLPIVKKVLEFGRSSRIRSTFAIQTPAQVFSTFGEIEGDVILGQAHNVLVFRHSDIKGCEYWSKRLGRMRGIEPKRGTSRQKGVSYGSQTTYSESVTESVNFERFDRERVTPSDIGDLPVGSYELGMFGFAALPLSLRIDPKTGFPEPIKWRFHMSPEWIATHVPTKGNFTPYQKTLKPESSYTLRPLEDWEYGFLDLTPPT